MLHSSVRCDAVDVCGCSTSARSTAPCGGATPGLTLIRGIIAHSTVFYEPAEMETLIRTRLSRPLVNMILCIPSSLPSSARPLVVFGAIVASNPNPAFVFILAALAPRSQSRSSLGYRLGEYEFINRKCLAVGSPGEGGFERLVRVLHVLHERRGGRW